MLDYELVSVWDLTFLKSDLAAMLLDAQYSVI